MLGSCKFRNDRPVTKDSEREKNVQVLQNKLLITQIDVVLDDSAVAVRATAARRCIGHFRLRRPIVHMCVIILAILYGIIRRVVAAPTDQRFV